MVSAHTWDTTPMTDLDLLRVTCALCGNDRPEPFADGYDYEFKTTADLFHMVRCGSCGHVYLNPRPKEEEFSKIYPPHYAAFVETRSCWVKKFRKHWEAKKVRRIRRLLGAGPKRLLDSGCGNGRFLSVLREYGDREWELVGIDLEAEAIAQCREKGLTGYEGKAEDFMLGEGTWDAVIMLQVLEHSKDPVRLCRKVHALLKPGGYWMIETPCLGSLDFQWFKKSLWTLYHFPRHWHLFSQQSLKALLMRCGFSIVQAEYTVAPTAWILSLHNFFRSKKYPDGFVRSFNAGNVFLLACFVILDYVLVMLGCSTSNQRVIARKPADV